MPQFTLANYKRLSRRGNVLVYGPSKSGKTFALSSLYKMGVKPIWIFDFDRGCDPFVRNITPADEKDIRIYRYGPKGGDVIGSNVERPAGQGRDVFLEFIKDINALYEFVDHNTDEWKENLAYGTVPACIVIDTATELIEVVMDYVLAMGGHALGAKGTDARSDFGKQMGKIVEIIKSIRGLPCLSIWNAHESVDKNELTGEIRNDPSFTGKLAATVGREFGVVLYSTTRTRDNKVEYVWYVAPQGYVKSAGSRFKDLKEGTIPQDYSLVL